MSPRPRDHGATDRLRPGKIPIDVLERSVLRMNGAPSAKVALGAKAGVDFGAVKVGDRYLIASSDPVTGVSSGIGAYAVNVNANDVATSGSRPEFLESVILLPEGSETGALEEIARDIDRTARTLRMAVLGGHTEVTPGLRRPIVVMTAFAFAEKFVSADMAKLGDSILMTKTAGVEGTAVLASSGRAAGMVPGGVLARAKSFLEQISVVEEAVEAYGTGLVHAMHDCTEGGVLGAAYEMSLASGVGFRVDKERIPVAAETGTICGTLGADPLKLIGSGSLLMAVKKGKEEKVESALDGVCRVSRIGSFTESGRTLVDGGRSSEVSEAPEDELWRVLGRRRR